MTDASRWRRFGQYLGLVEDDGGPPLPGSERRSRYDRTSWVSPRLDQDIDEIRARLAELERRLGG